jgi:hypothetical protein
MIFFGLNQCRIFYFTIIVPENSLYVIGCFGLKKTKHPKHLARNISKSWWRPFLSHIMIFFALNQCRIFYFTIIVPENSLYVIGCFGFEEKPKKHPKHLARNISKSWWRNFLSHIMIFFGLNQCRIFYFTLIIPENTLYVIDCFGFEEKPPKTSQTSYNNL